jgi:Mono-functional DNA-alkylating methyl methanesulfonate N-term
VVCRLISIWNPGLQVLAIGETVEEVNDSGFLGSTPTLRTQLMADDSMLQVRSASAAMYRARQVLHYPLAIDACQRNGWCPMHRYMVLVCATSRQTGGSTSGGRPGGAPS